MDALISIHDVMPDTLSRVDSLIDSMPEPCRNNLVLLIVPGKAWQPSQIEQLSRWQQSGLILAGHGWTHEVDEFGGWYHRLHGLVLSRRAAEHLSLDNQQIVTLMQNNFDWFSGHDLKSPDYYVPPAWALGAVNRNQLRQLPFSYLETTSGVMDISSGRVRRLPLAGFEADTLLRKGLLTLSNQFNYALAGVMSPLRIAIHPFDDEYLLGPALHNLLKKVERNQHYSELFPAGRSG